MMYLASHLSRCHIVIKQPAFSTLLAIVLDPGIVVYDIPSGALAVQTHCDVLFSCKFRLFLLIPHNLLFFVVDCCC